MAWKLQCAALLHLCGSIAVGYADDTIRLRALNLDAAGVTAVGLGHSADFAHQLHIAYSATVSGACIFSGQPYHCAVSHFKQDVEVPQTSNTRVPVCDGCSKNMTLQFDHCRRAPGVVDVGSLVDYPRRHCGQNPVKLEECIDDVNFFKESRAFVFRGTHDNVSAPGTVENTVALIAQMMTDPASSIKVVTDKAFPFTIPLASTPFAGSDQPAGYDGVGECLNHVYDTTMKVGAAVASNWFMFDQSEFSEQKIGFQETGWIYIPGNCKDRKDAGACKLVVRPDACAPPSAVAPDVAELANYAESNDIVVLHPCVGGPVDEAAFPNAPDVAAGKLDVFGQLSKDYSEQSGPHMRAVGKMVKRLLGSSAPPTVRSGASDTKLYQKTGRPSLLSRSDDRISEFRRMPTLKIDRRSIITAGCSNTADFAEQFHIAFSSIVTGSCIFSGQPYHCGATRFPNDYMVPKTDSTAAGIHCPGCDENGTLIYDHCKNHPEWVDIETLAKYAEGTEGVDDPRVHLADDRVFVFGPTHDRCYQPPAMENVANFHKIYAANAEQIKLVEDQPFPHTLPTNSTPYFNTNHNSTGAGYDGPGECLRHVFGRGERLYPSPELDASAWQRLNVSEFVPDKGVGMKGSAWLFVPSQCETGVCKLLMLPSGCDAFNDKNPPGGSTDDFARYGMWNDMVVFLPCAGGPIDTERFPMNHENLRGMVDVYGQLSPEYATQTGDQMAPIGNMIKKLIGLD